MKNIVYSMFSPGPYVHEIAYSLHSVYKFLPPERTDYRFIVYCSTPAEFEGVRATVLRFEPEQLREWAGPHNFGWRIKLKTLEDALLRFGEPVALLDGDTYFRKSPDRLFARIRPGRTVLHIREGKVRNLEDQCHRDLTQLLSRVDIPDPVTGTRIKPVAEMWNAGVIGIHPSDLQVVRDALALTDRLLAEEHIVTVEQFALSYCLGTKTNLRGCQDLVFHYWNKKYRKPFRTLIADLLPSTAGLPEAERARRLYEVRPQPSTAKKILNNTLYALDSCGIRLNATIPRQSG
jgi:hypothetical protein